VGDKAVKRKPLKTDRRLKKKK